MTESRALFPPDHPSPREDFRSFRSRDAGKCWHRSKNPPQNHPSPPRLKAPARSFLKRKGKREPIATDSISAIARLGVMATNGK